MFATASHGGVGVWYGAFGHTRLCTAGWTGESAFAWPGRVVEYGARPGLFLARIFLFVRTASRAAPHPGKRPRREPALQVVCLIIEGKFTLGRRVFLENIYKYIFIHLFGGKHSKNTKEIQ